MESTGDSENLDELFDGEATQSPSTCVTGTYNGYKPSYVKITFYKEIIIASLKITPFAGTYINSRY